MNSIKQSLSDEIKQRMRSGDIKQPICFAGGEIFSAAREQPLTIVAEDGA
jgi:hypothetical protein